VVEKPVTEKQWLRTADPNALFLHLQNRWSDRKRRLLACALCRDMGNRLRSELFSATLELVERWADGERDEASVDRAWDDVFRAHSEALDARDYDTALVFLRVLGCLSPLDPMHLSGQRVPTLRARIIEFGRDTLDWLRLGVSYRKVRPLPPGWCGIVRCMFGNPFRPAPFSPDWRTDTAAALARVMYES
jgi:hypothetical protein